MPPAGNQNKSTFSIDPAVSARVPGAIDTLAFSITFRGYTDALREFLNRLAQFELPIVVRSVEVERPSGSETVVAPPRRNEPEDIFARFGGEESEAQPDRNEGQGPVPVIEENISEFTVLLEFIEVVLPETQTQEDSDPA